MIRYLEEHRDRFGVEPICRTLAIAPSTYYAARTRPPSAHALRDAELVVEIHRVHAAQHGVYGVRKVWLQLGREGIPAGRDRVGRLMAAEGLAGVRRGASVRRTRPAPSEPPADLVGRVFDAPCPNRLWVADVTYVRIAGGFCYSAFIIDAFSRRIVGWQVASTATSELVLDALDLALWTRGQRQPGLVHHSDRGTQYLAIRYTNRLLDAGIQASVGATGDSYDNALAESVNALYKAELIHRRRWQTTTQVELATADWVAWWNTSRLHSACDSVPPSRRPSSRRPTNASGLPLSWRPDQKSLHGTQDGSSPRPCWSVKIIHGLKRTDNSSTFGGRFGTRAVGRGSIPCRLFRPTKRPVEIFHAAKHSASGERRGHCRAPRPPESSAEARLHLAG